MTCLFLALAPALASATDFPIGVNFGENAAYQLAPTESAGAPGFIQDHWNNLGRWGNPTVLNDHTGTATAVTLKWDATGIWQSGANEALGGNHKLMKGYLDSNGTLINADFNGVFGSDDDKPTLLITGLDTWMADQGLTSYKVVVYSEGDSNAGDRATRVWLAEADAASPVNGDPGLGADLTERVDIIDQSGWGADPTFVRVTGTSGVGNYTVFNGITASSIYLRIEEAGSNPWRSPINGFQIVGTDVPLADDSDSDGLPDLWEENYGLDPADDGSVNPDNGPDGDPDHDNRTHLQEYNDGTNPVKADSDDDGLDDGEEAALGTLPLDPDTDDDDLPDGWEVDNGLDPLDDGTADPDQGANGDPDNDLFLNIQEYEIGTDPQDEDTDDDGYTDAAEDLFGSWAGTDATGTDPRKADTDDDGIPDGEENPDLDYVAGVTPGTDPNFADTDGDGQTDRWEFLLGTDPTDEADKQPMVDVVNPGFELPEIPATTSYLTEVPDGWSIARAPVTDEVFVETLASLGLIGGEGLQYAGIQDIGNYIYQDTGVPFEPDTTYIIDLAGSTRGGFDVGVVEFGLFSSDDIGTPVAGYPGRMDLAGIRTASGNPDADNLENHFRDATALATIGSGLLGRPYVLVTGSTVPSGNLVAYIRHASGFRVMFDNIRIIAIPNTVDHDSDALPDAWELASNLSNQDDGSTLALNGPNGDPDNDSSLNANELATGSNPQDPDTDGDGLDDGVETATGIFVGASDTGTSPIAADTDGDGSSDSDEILAGTDPNDPLDFPFTGGPTVSAAAFNGAAFEITVEGLDPAKTYTLARSTTMEGFTALGDPVTGTDQVTFSDPAPPTGRAFYVIEEVTAP
ncbi:thrombospondin type 3 repeat-containing protein [Haloferula sargassicola]|uniref:thrombospondin type 3 repeat-containing protein n=1 Tax=Haloferula sargassicola TaxID=490096 RepID=UPI00336596D4